MFDNTWIEIENESWQLIATGKKAANRDSDKIQQKNHQIYSNGLGTNLGPNYGQKYYS